MVSGTALGKRGGTGGRVRYSQTLHVPTLSVMSQMRAVRSPEPETMRRPSREKSSE